MRPAAGNALTTLRKESQLPDQGRRPEKPKTHLLTPSPAAYRAAALAICAQEQDVYHDDDLPEGRPCRKCGDAAKAALDAAAAWLTDMFARDVDLRLQSVAAFHYPAGLVDPCELTTTDRRTAEAFLEEAGVWRSLAYDAEVEARRRDAEAVPSR